MATKQAVWGIDVGQCALKAIRLQAAGDKVEVLAFDTVEHEKILSHPESDAPSLIKTSLQKFASRNTLKGDLVSIAVPGQQTLSRFTKLPPVEPKKIPDIVRFEAGQQIPFDMDEVVWDYQTFSQPDSPDVEVGIFAIRKELIRKHVDQFTSVGVEPTLAQATPLAIYNCVRYERASETTATIVLDIGAQATDLIVIEGATIWARPVPIGGNAFTEALVKAFKLSHAKAENLKRTAASSKYARQIFQAMRPVFADLISEVQRSIGYYTSTHREAQIGRILGVGNAFKLPGLQKFMNQNLQIEVDRLASFKRVGVADAARAADFNEAAASMAVAIGLALQGLGQSAITSNLLPTELVRQIVWRRKSTYFAATAASLIGTAAVIWGSNIKAQSAIAGAGEQKSSGITTLDAAEAAINKNPGGEPALRYASGVLEGVRAFGKEYTTVANSTSELLREVNVFKELGTFNPIVARLVATLTEGIKSQAPGLAGAEDGAAYEKKIREAKQAVDDLRRAGVPAGDPKIAALQEIAERGNRKELWIRSFRMVYMEDLGEVVKTWTRVDPKVAETVAGQPGWRIVLRGRTPKSDPAGWIEDVVIPGVIAAGRKPEMGFYFHAMTLKSIAKVRAPDGDTADAGAAAAATPPAAGGGAFGGGAGRPPGGAAGAAAGAAEEGFKVDAGQDSVTLETYVGSDSDVDLELLAVHKNTPPEMLPQGAAPADGSAAPGAAPAKPAGGDAPPRD